MTTKANLAYGEFKLELEGSEAFVVSQLDTFGAKIPQLKGLASNLSKGGGEDAPDLPEESEVDLPKEEKKPRRAAAKSNGPSCGARIRTLIDDGFFDSIKKSGEIGDKLKEKATPYEAKHVSAALINMTKAGKLRRIKQDKVWVYVKP